MAQRRRPPDEPAEPPRLTASRDQVREELAERIEMGNRLLEAVAQIRNEVELEAAKADYYTWSDYNTTLLKKRFTTSELADEYSRFLGGVFYDDFFQRVEDHARDISDKIRRLASISERLPLYEEPAEIARAATPENAPPGNTIFIVHGRDTETKLAVHGFLREVTSLKAVVLHEQAEQGRTIIEKFVDHASDAAYAVIILTGDDVGGPKDARPEQLEPRARQNVVFEHGFFTGTLGRSRVAILYEEGVELPSDLQGIVYMPLDEAGAWKIRLARELKAAHLPIDPEKLL